MERPRWMSPEAWQRLVPVLHAQPGHAADALLDLGSVTRCWDAERRTWLVLRVADRARLGMALPAALMLALCEALDD